MRSARRWHTIRPEIKTNDNILCSLHSLHSLHSLLHRSKVDSPHNILHRNMDILHSKHVDKRDDKPGERDDGRVHNSNCALACDSVAVCSVWLLVITSSTAQNFETNATEGPMRRLP